MIRRICDGCYESGTLNDITGRLDCARVAALESSTARMLDLCPECLPLYSKYLELSSNLASTRQREYVRDRDVLVASLWKELKHGKQAEATPSAGTWGAVLQPAHGPTE